MEPSAPPHGTPDLQVLQSTHPVQRIPSTCCCGARDRDGCHRCGRFGDGSARTGGGDCCMRSRCAKGCGGCPGSGTGGCVAWPHAIAVEVPVKVLLEVFETGVGHQIWVPAWIDEDATLPCPIHPSMAGSARFCRATLFPQGVSFEEVANVHGCSNAVTDKA